MDEQSTGHSGWRRATGMWVLVGLLAAIATWLAVELVGDGTPAGAQVMSAAQSGKILAVAGQVTSDSYGLYVVDLESGTIALYQWLPNTRKFRLLAARNCTYDLKLDEYNTEPSVNEIQSLIQQSRRLSEAPSP